MSWTYKGKEFDELSIPKGAIGFIYSMTAIIDGKSVAYIGKKNFFSNVKKPLGKKACPPFFLDSSINFSKAISAFLFALFSTEELTTVKDN